MKPADVPAGPLLVDTDVVSYWVLKADQAAAFTELVAGRPQAISFATYGELLAVGHKATWGERRLNELRAHLKTFVVLPYQASVVELWARMHAKLAGHLDPQLPVVTNNLKDFRSIQRSFPALRLVHPDL
jgi:predicted nucleic acid-binding protein